MLRLSRVLLASALLLAACQSSQSAREALADEPQQTPMEIQVREAEGEEATLSSVENPPVFVWTPPAASWVEVRHEATGRVVWRIEQRGNPHGPAYLASPLVYGSYARCPGWSPPPDAAEPVAMPAETLMPGERYRVIVHRTDVDGPISQPTDVREHEATVAFTY